MVIAHVREGVFWRQVPQPRPTFAPTTWAFFIAWASQPTGASNIRPVPKPPRVGIDRSSDHTVDLARCGELIGRGIGAYTPVLPQRRVVTLPFGRSSGSAGTPIRQRHHSQRRALFIREMGWREGHRRRDPGRRVSAGLFFDTGRCLPSFRMRVARVLDEPSRRAPPETIARFRRMVASLIGAFAWLATFGFIAAIIADVFH